MEPVALVLMIIGLTFMAFNKVLVDFNQFLIRLIIKWDIDKRRWRKVNFVQGLILFILGVFIQIKLFD